MFAAVPALYALAAVAAALVSYWTDSTALWIAGAFATGFFGWCTYVCIKRSRGE